MHHDAASGYHVLQKIGEIREETYAHIEGALASGAWMHDARPQKPESSGIADIFSFLFSGAMGFSSVLILAMLVHPEQKSPAVALRNPPVYECVGRNCSPVSASASSRAQSLQFQSPRSSAASSKAQSQTSSTAGNSASNPFKRFHMAPPDLHKMQVRPRADNVQGVYLSAGSMKRTDFVQKTIDSVLASGGNSIVFDVKGSRVFFKSQSPLANELELVNNLYDLGEVLDRFKAAGIYTVARIVSVKDAGLAQAKPSTVIKNPKTGVYIGGEWVDPSNPDVLEYNRQVFCEIASAGIDEINLDYIRFSTANFGELKVFTGEQKADRVEQFIKMARSAIDECGHGTRLGLSTYAILGWNYEVNLETLGQDVVRFAPLVDIISPMAYPATFTSEGYYVPGKHPGPRDYWLVYRTLTGYAKLLGPEHEHKIRPWIQGYYVDAADVRDQIRAVYDAGYCGFQLWNANNNYGESYAAMKNPPAKPDRCKD